MSRPPFSRKRKGKKVDPYPLGQSAPSKMEQTKGGVGRPKKPKEIEEETGYLNVHYDAAATTLSGHLEVLEDDGEPTDLVESALAKLEAGEELDEEELTFVSEYMRDDAEDLDPEDWPEIKPAAEYFEAEMRRRGFVKKVYNTSESIDDLQERGYALAFDFPDRESAREQVAELTAQGHKAKIIPINDFSEYEVWAKRKSEQAYSLGDRVLVFGTWYTVDDIADSGTLELVDEGTMETLLVEKSQFHNIEEHEK